MHVPVCLQISDLLYDIHIQYTCMRTKVSVQNKQSDDSYISLCIFLVYCKEKNISTYQHISYKQNVTSYWVPECTLNIQENICLH